MLCLCCNNYVTNAQLSGEITNLFIYLLLGGGSFIFFRTGGSGFVNPDVSVLICLHANQDTRCNVCLFVLVFATRQCA